jgi:hypothetical protein
MRRECYALGRPRSCVGIRKRFCTGKTPWISHLHLLLTRKIFIHDNTHQARFG